MKWEVDKLIPGMRLGENVYMPGSKVFLLPKDKELTSSDINGLITRGIKTVNIEYSNNLSTFSDTFNGYVHDAIKTNNIDGLINYATKCNNLSNENEVINVDLINVDFENSDEYTELVTRTNMAICMAKMYNLNASSDKKINIEQLFMASTLQNIGKVLENPMVFAKLAKNYNIKKVREQFPSLPENILTEYNEDYLPVYSWMLLKNLRSRLDYVITTSVLLQEETINADGPLKVNMEKYKNNSSYNISMIMNTAKMFYDTFKMNYKNTGDPFDNLDYIVQSDYRFSGVDPYWIYLFKQAVPIYPVGSYVELNDGTEAQVVKLNNFLFDKPIVLTEAGETIDLSRTNICVVSPYKEVGLGRNFFAG